MNHTRVSIAGIAHPDGVRAVRVVLEEVSGRNYGRMGGSLAEIEVIARGDTP